jgi:hypothetical protein
VVNLFRDRKAIDLFRDRKAIDLFRDRKAIDLFRDRKTADAFRDRKTADAFRDCKAIDLFLRPRTADSYGALSASSNICLSTLNPLSYKFRRARKFCNERQASCSGFAIAKYGDSGEKEDTRNSVRRRADWRLNRQIAERKTVR